MDTVEYTNSHCGLPLIRRVEFFGKPAHSWVEYFECRKCGFKGVPRAPLPDNGECYLVEVAALRALLFTAGEPDITN